MRINVAMGLFFTCFMAVTSTAQCGPAYCVCKSNTAGPFKVPVPAAGEGQCSIACNTNGGYKTGYEAPNCPKESGIPVQYGSWDVSWAIWHEGATVYEGDDLLSDDVIYSRIVEKQHGLIQESIKKAGPQKIASDVAAVLDSCRFWHPLREHLAWVCQHEHQGDRLNALAKAGDIDGVKNLYHRYESHNPDLQNIAACYNKSQIITMLKQDCGYDTWVPPKPQPQPMKERTGTNGHN